MARGYRHVMIPRMEPGNINEAFSANDHCDVTIVHDQLVHRHEGSLSLCSSH